MKQRFNFLDIRAISNELNDLLPGKYIQNIYSFSQRLFTFKFNSKELLLIEPGIRVHLTTTQPTEISHFCSVLRKRIRNARIESVYQVGFDRIMVIQLNYYKLVIEFFSSGNILLLDKEDMIVEVYRIVRDMEIQKGTKYVFNFVELGNLPFEPALRDVLEDKEEEWIAGLKNQGCIIYKNSKPESFHPVMLPGSVRFNTFNEAVDTFFPEKIKKKEATNKLDKIKKKQQERLDAIYIELKELENTISIFESNEHIITKILLIFENTLKNKIKWDDFARFKKLEEEKGNEWSKRIVKYDFKKAEATIDIGCDEPFFVGVFMTKNYYANLNEYYNKKKYLKEKIEKTKKGIETALSGLKEKFKPKEIVIKRKMYWFEKFHFCIIENALIIGGKNAQQNETIVKKYMEKDDLYFHSEIIGGSSIVLKADNKVEKEILIESAAAMALCMSKCWSEGVVKPVWYVSAEQVSKSAPTGEFLSKGGFLIKGKKTYVESYRLEYGIGIMFRKSNEKESDEIKECNDIDVINEKLMGLTIADGFFSTFIHTPKEGDKILHAIPICGPWRVIKEFKYKVKLIPGKEKKGKIVKELVNRFLKGSEKDHLPFIKGICMDEYMNVMISDCKIAKTS
ncbi:Nuclear export mediator factor Nemf [Astathelohania contejeani]|uniref:Nuclear export mediator factor Nemf n=1 Tax=Astathelohania contejeani TaxID=164912 RepID=A0ABQ7HWK3_9MICR|nr:Nuclear export mediator factor Nemf [Thelohania contejeani]